MDTTSLLTREDLKSAIEQAPRVRLANIPTPVEELSRLSDALGGTRILIKRDDLTGLGSAATRCAIWSSAWEMPWPKDAIRP